MATKTIPARTIKTCDTCGTTIEQTDHHGMVLKLIKDALDYQGMPVANGSEKYDLCYKCRERLEKAIRSEIAAIKNGVAVK